MIRSLGPDMIQYQRVPTTSSNLKTEYVIFESYNQCPVVFVSRNVTCLSPGIDIAQLGYETGTPNN